LSSLLPAWQSDAQKKGYHIEIVSVDDDDATPVGVYIRQIDLCLPFFIG
jgi:hypothetical protein